MKAILLSAVLLITFAMPHVASAQGTTSTNTKTGTSTSTDTNTEPNKGKITSQGSKDKKLNDAADGNAQ